MSPLRRPLTGSTLVVSLAAIIALGMAGAVAAYRTVLGEAGVSTPTRPVVQMTTSTPLTDVTAGTVFRKVRWAPCTPPAELEDGVCVTDVVHTVPVAPAPAPATSDDDTDEPEPSVSDDDATGLDDEAEVDDDEGEDVDDEGDDAADDGGQDDANHQADHQADHEADHEAGDDHGDD